MISNLYYLSILLDNSVSLEGNEKDAIFFSAMEDRKKQNTYIQLLRKEIQEIKRLKHERFGKINQLVAKTNDKQALANEVGYSSRFHKRLDEIHRQEEMENNLQT